MYETRSMESSPCKTCQVPTHVSPTYKGDRILCASCRRHRRPNAWKRSMMMGAQAEQRFVDACKRRGWPCRAATRDENMFSHFDFVVQAQQSGVHHTLYSREGRDDLVMVLDIEDIVGLGYRLDA